MKLINILLIILTLLITVINIFLMCQRQTYINQIDEKIKYLKTRHDIQGDDSKYPNFSIGTHDSLVIDTILPFLYPDTEYIEEYLQDHKGE